MRAACRDRFWTMDPMPSGEREAEWVADWRIGPGPLPRGRFDSQNSKFNPIGFCVRAPSGRASALPPDREIAEQCSWPTDTRCQRPRPLEPVTDPCEKPLEQR